MEDDEGTYEEFLVHSARGGDIEDVKEMIEVTGPPVNLDFQDPKQNKNTALHMACANGFDKIVTLLLNSNRVDLNL